MKVLDVAHYRTQTRRVATLDRSSVTSIFADHLISRGDELDDENLGLSLLGITRASNGSRHHVGCEQRKHHMNTVDGGSRCG
jgi:hypothetical protein